MTVTVTVTVNTVLDSAALEGDPLLRASGAVDLGSLVPILAQWILVRPTHLAGTSLIHRTLFLNWWSCSARFELDAVLRFGLRSLHSFT